ncbi:MAG: hypothetical protein ABI134_32520 [Byssovorax sp.]
MNFKIAFVGAALMAFGGLFAVGCGGNDCEAAADTISAKLAGCPKPPTVTTTSSTGASAECTDAAGALLKCQAAAFDAASCDCIGGGDITKCTADQAKSFSDAFTACK